MKLENLNQQPAGNIDATGPDLDHIESIQKSESEHKEKLKIFLDGFTKAANEFLKQKGDTEFIALAYVNEITDLETNKKIEQPRLVFRSTKNSLKEFVIMLPMDFSITFSDIASVVAERYERVTFVEPELQPSAKEDNDIPGPATSSI